MKKYIIILFFLFLVSSDAFCFGKKMCSDTGAISTTEYVVLDKNPENQFLQEYLVSISCDDIKIIFGKANKEKLSKYVRKQNKKTEQIDIKSDAAATINNIIKAMTYMSLIRDNQVEFDVISSQYENTDLKNIFDFLKLKSIFINGEIDQFLELSKKFDQDKIISDYIEYDGYILPLPRTLKSQSKLSYRMINKSLNDVRVLENEILSINDIELLYQKREKYLNFRLPDFAGGLSGSCGMWGIGRANGAEEHEVKIRFTYYKKMAELFKINNPKDSKYLSEVLSYNLFDLSYYPYNLPELVFEKVDLGETETKKFQKEIIEYLIKNLKTFSSIPVLYSDSSLLSWKTWEKEKKVNGWSPDNSFGDLLINSKNANRDLVGLSIDISKTQQKSFVQYLNDGAVDSPIYKINEYFYVFAMPQMDKKLILYSSYEKDIPYYLIFSKKDGKIKIEYLYITTPFYDPDGGPC